MKTEKTMLQQILDTYRQDEDLCVRTLNCGSVLTVISLDAISDSDKISQYVLQPLAHNQESITVQQVQLKLATGAIVKTLSNTFFAIECLQNGYTLVFDSEGQGIAVDTRTTIGRAVIEPPTSTVMKGPREGFVEDVKVNVALIRKRLKTNQLKKTTVQVGKYTKTAVTVCYLQDVASQEIVDVIIQKLNAVSIDGILDSSYVARYLDTSKTALFKRVGTTEKPDIAVGKMLEGRVVVLVDGSPIALTLPYLFIEDLQGPNDYYEPSSITTLNRSLRLVGAILSVLLPALYVCLQMYNYQIIPLKFLITVLNATEAIPFSPLTEMLLVLIIFDVLREANLRMPSAVGISLSLVGAIVLGDAAVKAGLIGAPAVMIGALSGIGLFTMPNNTLLLSLLRLALTLIGGIMGILGVILSIMAILLYVVSLQSYNTPFLAPYSPSISADKQDAVAQKPLTKWTTRPQSLPNKNKKRRG